MKHKATRIDNLMYKGCEPHWKCIYCGDCIPFHCFKKDEFEQMDCKCNVLTEKEVSNDAQEVN